MLECGYMGKSDIDKNEDISSESSVRIKKSRGRLGKFLGLAVLIVLAAGYYGWQYLKINQSPLLGGTANQAKDQKVNQQEIMAVVAKVKQLMIVPENELPQMAEISNAALAIKEQPFYAGSQNGDKVLVYLSARKAIIYSPARNIIVNVGPIYMNNEAPAPAATTTPKKK